MFEQVRGQKSIGVEPGAVIELLVSNNDNMVAIDPYPLQEAVASIVVCRGAAGIECSLHFAMMEHGAGVVFRWNGPVTKANYDQVMGEARDFVESMGFLMDDKEYRQQAVQQQKALYDSALAFKPDGAATSGAQTAVLLPDETDVEVEVEADVDDDIAGSESIVFLESTGKEIPGGARPSSAAPKDNPARPIQSRQVDPKEVEKWKIVSRILAAF